MKEQIEEMRKEVARIHRFFLEDDDYESLDEYIADMLYNAGYRKQREARYRADPNYRTLGNCGECGGDVTCLNKFCPNCGAKMKGGAE